ncbi:MAG TPA: Sir2 family NAD-dependent protein deacetylase [Phycisphaerales bacterium]|nr:Sir2 family NAD-dependent protein deacetylase [Phycisphaerales bacterium]HMP37285.1 Sir2 family NAD-dependent protein deacetylase [Phycisphaerales bacterium]
MRSQEEAIAVARDRLAEIIGGGGTVVALTGAGISAESGIPTFRGRDGYWTIGSRNYQPEELATMAAFREMPRELWAWYLKRRADCRRATPNPAHRALVELDARLGPRMRLVTQNIDGLHGRAGHEASRLYEIHGNLDFMRPVRELESRPRIVPIPDAVGLDWPNGRALDEATERLLRVDGAPARPHVLWFDECYDEERFRSTSALEAAASADLLLIVGTTGSTTLPTRIAQFCAGRGVPIVVVDPEPGALAAAVRLDGRAIFVRATAGEALPRMW